MTNASARPLVRSVREGERWALGLGLEWLILPEPWGHLVFAWNGGGVRVWDCAGPQEIRFATLEERAALFAHLARRGDRP